MTTTIHIDINPAKLALSTRYQARKTPGQLPLAELAASIAALGLLQNLVVTKSKKKGVYEVVAGGRRLQAIQILLADGRWSEGQTVQVMEVAGNIALDASITENVHREAMHPADEFEAFAKLIEQGKTIEDVAATFGVVPTLVKRRLRLAAVAPELMTAYRADEMSLDVLMAFTVTDDQDRQRDTWAAIEGWQRNNPRSIRSMLTQETMTADHRQVKYITLEAYEAAGGRVFRDLFAQENDLDGIYIQDVALANQLALEKLASHTAQLEAAGWGWVETRLENDSQEWHRHGRIYSVERDLTKAEAKIMATLQSDAGKISAEMDALADDENDGQWLELEEKHEALTDEIHQIELAATVWPTEMMPLAGCVVSIGYSGNVEVQYGLVHPDNRTEIAQAVAAAENETGICMRTSLPEPATRPVHSERLVRQLTANKVGIVQAALASQPTVMLSVLVAQLAQAEFTSGYSRGFGLGISRQREGIEDAAPDFEGSKAHVELQSIRLHWLDQLPKDEDGDVLGLLEWSLEQDQGTLLELLAFLVAGSVQGIQHQEPKQATALDLLGDIAGVTMAEWWTPTAATYLSHVSKDRILDVVAQGAGSDAAALLIKMKKGEAVAAAQVALDGKGWLPAALQINKGESNV